jgi:aldose 1-epimerase
MSKPLLHTYKVLSPNRFIGELDGQAIGLFTLRNANGAFVNICNYGARVVQIVVPSAEGVLGDVALGFEDLEGCMRASPNGVPSMGAFIGRYANRIANGQFSLEGKAHQLSINSGTHCIHGGQGGSRYAVFSTQQTAGNQLVLTHTFTPENDGFPGNLKLTVTYILDDTNALRIAWQACALDTATVASFTSHVFFNLSNAPASPVSNHLVQLHAQRYLPLQANQVPTGELLPVAGTPFDFRQTKRLGLDLYSDYPQIMLCGGYDHHFAVDDWNGKLQRIATVTEPSSARTLTVFSTEPGVQLFTANGLDQAQCGFARHSGLCIEPSYFPDSPNQTSFPSTRLDAGQERTGEIVYAFT